MAEQEFCGYPNSATYLAALYLGNDFKAKQRIESLIDEACNLDPQKLAAIFKVRRAKEGEDFSGVKGNEVTIDHWAEGEVDWVVIAKSEVADRQAELESPAALSTLQQLLAEATIEGLVVKLPRQLEREQYSIVSRALNKIGGRWNRGKQGFLFSEDPAAKVHAVINSGKVVKDDDFGFFKTQEPLGREVIAEAEIEPGMKVCDPSAGDGALARLAAEIVGIQNVDTFELQPCNVAILRDLGFSPVQGDFLDVAPEPRYDRIIMNPPFARQQDIDHVRHAWTMVKPGGKLVAIMSASVDFRSNRKTQEFREFLEQHGRLRKNPEGSFKESGTMASTVTVVLDKPIDSTNAVVYRKGEILPHKSPEGFDDEFGEGYAYVQPAHDIAQQDRVVDCYVVDEAGRRHPGLDFCPVPVLVADIAAKASREQLALF